MNELFDEIDQRVWERSEEIKWQAAELERIRGTGRDYRPHDDPEVPPHSRFLMNLKIQNVGKWLEPGDANRKYFEALAKDPARVRTVARVHAYGLQWFNLTLKDLFRMHNVFWDEEDEQKSSNQDDEKSSQPPDSPQKKAEPSASAVESGARVSRPASPCSDGSGAGGGAVAVVPRSPELRRLLTMPPLVRQKKTSWQVQNGWTAAEAERNISNDFARWGTIELPKEEDE